MSSYNVYVTTSDILNAGTDANVYIVLIGEVFGYPRQSEKIPLKSAKKNTNNFEQGQTDFFPIKCSDIGRLRKIRIGHDNKGFGPGWHLEKVVIESLEDNKTYVCECNKWLARDEDDGKIERELTCFEQSNIERSRHSRRDNKVDFGDTFLDKFSKSKKYGPNDHKELYRIIITNSDQNVPGFEPNLVLQLIGDQNQTDKIQLEKIRKKRIDNFELTYDLELPYLGNIEAVKIGLNTSRPALNWHLGDIIIQGPNGNSFTFKCHNLLDMKSPERELFASKSPRDPMRKPVKMMLYKITTRTSSVKHAGTDANVYCHIFGEEFETGKLLLNSSKTHRNKFEEGKEDIFEIRAPDVGDIKKIRIGHDNKGIGPGWHLNDVIIETEDGKKYTFPCNEWLARDEADGKLERDLIPLEQIRKKSSKQHLFIETVQDYHVYVKTSDISNAGTDAKVYIKIYGEYHQSGEIFLDKSETHRNKFEKGNLDRFTIKQTYFGDIHAIKIGHDNSGAFAGWHLNEVIIENTAEDRKWIFPCNRWLADNEADNLLEVKLTPIKTDSSIYATKKKYLVDVYTGDVPNAGTDSEVFLAIYGEKGETSEIHLKDSKTHWNKFENSKDDSNNAKHNFAQLDQFEVEENDLGQLYCVRIRHDNSGIKPSWFLERIEITDTTDNNKYYFICKKWLSRIRDDQRIERIIKEINYEPDYRPKFRRDSDSIVITGKKDTKRKHRPIALGKRYYVKVYTSKRQNIFGTDMNVFIRIFGDYGTSKENKLKTELTNQKNSKTNEEKFLRNNVDLFVVESKEDLGTIYAIELRFGQCLTFFQKTNDLSIEKIQVCDGVYEYEFEFDETVSTRDFYDIYSHLVERKLILLEKSALF